MADRAFLKAPAHPATGSDFTELLIAHFHDAVLGIDADHCITLVNASAESLFGQPRSALVGGPLDRLLPRSVRARHSVWVNTFLSSDTRARFMSGGRAIKYTGDDGRTLFIEATIVRTDDFHDRTVAVAVLRDVTEQRSILHSLRQAANVFASTREGVIITDPDGRIISVNQAFTDITGYCEAEALGQAPSLLSSGRHGREFYRQMWDSIAATGQWQGEIWNRRKSGDIFPEWLTISTVTDERGEVVNYVGVFADISRVKEAEARVDELAHYNPLTRLPNRDYLRSRLDQAVTNQREAAGWGALFICNVDRFRTLNESIGYEAGDEILKSVAERIQACLDENDVLAHIRGDEFAVLIEDLSDERDLARLGSRITRVALDEPIRLDDAREVYTSITVGIAVYSRDALDAQSLLQAADTAMHRAKQEEGGSWRFYDESQARRARDRFELEGELRRAIERQEFAVHYQPVVSVKHGTIVGAEALVRWVHPERGIVSPASFISVAEESGLIEPIGRWILHAACREFAGWRAVAANGMFLSVNLSPRQFRSEDLIADLERILAETDLAPSRLSLEITENTLMQYGDETEDALRRLHELGVRLSIDDFGTGYSSLAYLKRFRADHLKIDRSFINDLPDDHDSAQIVTAIFAMGAGLEMEIISEGIETEAQRRFIHRHGGRVMQGFLASRPVAGDEFRALLEARAPLLPELD